MLTRVELSGFRNFVEFATPLRTLEVIAGPNAAGKSNFFDALHLLAALAEDDLATAFGRVRGEALEQFTCATPNQRVSEMTFAVEAVLPREIRDQWGESATLSETHLRYELKIVVDETDTRPRIRIAHELLRGLRREESTKTLVPLTSQAFATHFVERGSRKEPYIDTEGQKLVLHQDGRAGRKREYLAQEAVSSVLSAANTVTFRHAFAFRQELASIRFLHLEPERLRSPSRIVPFDTHESTRLDPAGANLPAVLARLRSVDPSLLGQIARDLRAVIRDLTHVDVREDKVQQQLVAEAGFEHGGPFPASLLSDGTLRLIALAALEHDTEHKGVLCFEEPENGVHPQRIKGLLGILEGLATSRHGPYSKTETLRQLLVNTHSPALVSAVDQDVLLFAETRRHFHPTLGASILASRFLPVVDELPIRQKGEQMTNVTRREVVDYLSSVDIHRWESGEGDADSAATGALSS